jgi:Rrf2 family protein
VRAGLVVSTRGVQGGYALARPATAISAAEIIDALEGPVAITECSSGNGCDLESFCRVGMAWQRINQSIRQALDDVTLADLQQRREPLPPPNLRAGLHRAAGTR